MNKKIVFIFLVLLCSLNMGIFSQYDSCPIYNNSGRGLSIRVTCKNFSKSIYEVFVQSKVSRVIVIGKDDIKISGHGNYKITFPNNGSYITIPAYTEASFKVDFIPANVKLTTSDIKIETESCN